MRHSHESGNLMKVWIPAYAGMTVYVGKMIAVPI